MKRVLIYTDCFCFGGCENVIPVLLKDKELNRYFKISLSYRYSVKYEEGLKQKINIDEHNVFPIRLLGYSDGDSLIDKIVRRLTSVFEIILMIYDVKIMTAHFKEVKPEILFINNGGYPGARTCRSAVIAAKIAGVKYIYFNVNNIAEPYNSMRRFIQYPIDYIIKNNVTRFAAASRYARKKLIEVLKLKSQKTLWILNTFEKKSINVKRDDIRQRYVKDQNTILIGSVGHLALHKGHQHLLVAITKLKKQYGCKKFKLVIIGEGPERNNLCNYVIENDLSDHVEIIPFQWNVFDYYNAMDIYVHPSIAFDDLPFAVREAMSMELPIIGTDFAGIPELVEDGINGKLVKPGDPVLLAEAISCLIEHEDDRKKYGEESCNIYKKYLSPQAVVRGYYKLFNGELP